MVKLRQVDIHGEASIIEIFNNSRTVFLIFILEEAVRQEGKIDWSPGFSGQVTPLERRKNPPCTNSMFCTTVISSLPGKCATRFRVIGTVPMDGRLTITGCPGCDVVGCSLFPEGGVLDSIFAKNAWLIGLPIYIVQLMEYFGK